MHVPDDRYVLSLHCHISRISLPFGGPSLPTRTTRTPVRRPTSGRRETLTRRRPLRSVSPSLHGAPSSPSSPSFSLSLSFPPHLLFLTNIRLGGPLSLPPRPRDVTGKRLRGRAATVVGAKHRSTTLIGRTRLGYVSSDLVCDETRHIFACALYSCPRFSVVRQEIKGNRGTEGVMLVCPRHGDGREGQSHSRTATASNKENVDLLVLLRTRTPTRRQDRRKKESENLHTGQWL